VPTTLHIAYTTDYILVSTYMIHTQYANVLAIVNPIVFRSAKRTSKKHEWKRSEHGGSLPLLSG